MTAQNQPSDNLKGSDQWIRRFIGNHGYFTGDWEGLEAAIQEYVEREINTVIEALQELDQSRGITWEGMEYDWQELPSYSAEIVARRALQRKRQGDTSREGEVLNDDGSGGYAGDYYDNQWK